MGSINSETPYLHQVKLRGTSCFLTKRSTWNIYIFWYTFHDNTPPPNRYIERGDGVYIKRRNGVWGYYIDRVKGRGGEGRGIKNYNYNRYRALYPHLNTSSMKSETSPTPVTWFTLIGWGQKFLPFRLNPHQPGKLVLLLSWWGWVKLNLTTFHVEHIKICIMFHDN